MPGLTLILRGPKPNAPVHSGARFTVPTPRDVGRRIIYFHYFDAKGVSGGINVLGSTKPAGTTIDSQPLSPRELEFWLERAAFEMIPKTQLAKHEGQYVASRDGKIIESDSSLEALTNKFFMRYGDVSVYMTKVGDEEPERIDTPFE